MRLSTSTEFIRCTWGDFEALRMIKEAGFDCFDYSCHREDANIRPVMGDDYLENAHKLRELADSLNLPCNQSHTPFVINPDNYNPDLSDWRYRDLIRSMEAAAIVGAPHTVVHVLGNERTPDFWKNCIEYYKRLEPWCEKFGIKIAVENLWCHDPKRGYIEGRRLSTPEKLNAMVRELDSPWFVALADVGHAALVYGEPEDFILETDPALLKGLHVHDTTYRDDTHTLPFQGRQNWDAIMDALAKIGYTGDLTYEIDNFLVRSCGNSREIAVASLCYAEKVGRCLIEKFETAKAGYSR